MTDPLIVKSEDDKVATEKNFTKNATEIKVKLMQDQKM